MRSDSMAILKSEGLVLELSNIVQYNSDSIVDLYEQFDIFISIHNQPVFSSQVLRKTYELVSSNMRILIESIQAVLLGSDVISFDTEEPNFEITIQRTIDRNKPSTQFILPEQMTENFYEVVIWISSGNWMKIYGNTAVGIRLSVSESELQKFHQELVNEYQNRKITNYKWVPLT